jgi:hypothetical protein
MCVGIDEARKNNHPVTVDLANVLLILSIPGIAQGLAGLADSDDFAGLAEDGGVFDNAKFPKIGSAPRSRFGGTQG